MTCENFCPAFLNLVTSRTIPLLTRLNVQLLYGRWNRGDPETSSEIEYPRRVSSVSGAYIFRIA